MAPKSPLVKTERELEEDRLRDRAVQELERLRYTIGLRGKSAKRYIEHLDLISADADQYESPQRTLETLRESYRALTYALNQLRKEE
jgi:hypothetical protein